MPKHKICDANESSSEDSDDERFKALVSEAVDPVLHKSLYDKQNKESSDKKTKSKQHSSTLKAGVYYIKRALLILKC